MKLSTKLRKKIKANQWLSPYEMVDLMKYIKHQKKQGIPYEQTYTDLGIDPSKSVIK